MIHVGNGMISQSSVTHLVAINSPTDVFRSPFHSVGVPVGMRVESMGVLMRFDLFVAINIAIDHVQRQRIV